MERRRWCTAAPSCLSSSATIWLIHAMNFQFGTSRDCEERGYIWEVGVAYSLAVLAGYIVHTSNRVAPIIGSAIAYQPKYIDIILEPKFHQPSRQKESSDDWWWHLESSDTFTSLHPPSSWRRPWSLGTAPPAAVAVGTAGWQHLTQTALPSVSRSQQHLEIATRRESQEQMTHICTWQPCMWHSFLKIIPICGNHFRYCVASRLKTKLWNTSL